MGSDTGPCDFDLEYYYAKMESYHMMEYEYQIKLEYFLANGILSYAGQRNMNIKYNWNIIMQRWNHII